MVFVAKLVTFLVVCGICSVTTVAVGLLPYKTVNKIKDVERHGEGHRGMACTNLLQSLQKWPNGLM